MVLYNDSPAKLFSVQRTLPSLAFFNSRFTTSQVPTIPIPTIPLAATLNGGGKAIGAEFSGPGGTPLAVTVGANLGGTGTPIAVEAGLRHTTVIFKLFGFIPLLTIKVR